MDEHVAAFRKLLLDKTVNDLVGKKKGLPPGQTLPRNTYSTAVQTLSKFNIIISVDALKKQVNRAYAKALSTPTPLTPMHQLPPAEVGVELLNTSPTSEISSIATASAAAAPDAAAAPPLAAASANSSATSTAKSGGRPKGTTNANKAAAAKLFAECLNAITKEYAAERKTSDTHRKRLPHNFLKKLIKEKKTEFGIADETVIKPRTIESRYERHKKDPERHKLDPMHQGVESPLIEVERSILEIVIGMGRIRQPMTKPEVLKMMNDAIKGTSHEKVFIEFKRKRTATEINDDAVVGEKWWDGFLKRNKVLLDNKKCVLFCTNRADWTRFETFDDMYKAIYKQMVEAGVAVKLDAPVFTDREGNVVSEDDPQKFGLKQKCKVVHAHLIFFADETGCNTSLKKDPHVGGRKYLVEKGAAAQRTASRKDHPFTLLPFTSANGEAVCCVIIFQHKSDEVPLAWASGIDPFIPEEKVVRNPDGTPAFVPANIGPGKIFPGGPICQFNGKEVPCLFYCSPSGGITGEILTQVLEEFDKMGIAAREDGVTPFLLVDGHGSRLDPSFLKYINDENHKWRVCLGIPYGTSLWQVGDSSEQNSSFKIAFADAKDKLLTMKNDMGLPRCIEPTDIMILLNIAWHAFTNTEANQRAVSGRGWNPLNSNLLLHPSLQPPATSASNTTTNVTERR